MKFLTCIFTFLLLFTSSFAIKADENVYCVMDSSSEEILEEFSDYKSAIRYFNKHKDEYKNLSLLKNDKVIETEYAVVYFNYNDGCLIETKMDDDRSFNSCYASDAVYLYSEYDEVYYMISGVIGHLDNSQLTIVPVSEYPENVSVYTNMEGALYHNILSSNLNNYYAYSVELDDALPFLVDGVNYYSGDGHYFYENYHEMVDDLLNHSSLYAVNKKAYYNYYQYLPLRSETNISLSSIESYFSDTLLINAKLDGYEDANNDGANDYLNKSQLYGELDSFYTAENIYGINALTLLSISIYESSYGKNLSSFVENNLFSSAAFSSQKERESGRYMHLEDSVYSFARYYLVQKYTNPLRSSYHGGYLGNKASGFSASYSNDPYYGEKVASVYYRIDRALGYTDRNSECLIQVNGTYNLYKDVQCSQRILHMTDIIDNFYVVLDELEDVYKIQLDKCFDPDYQYDWQDNVAYIAKDEGTLINADKQQSKEYMELDFDFRDGRIGLNETASIHISKQVSTMIPYKEGYEFEKYKDGIAQYKKIDSISLSKGFENIHDLSKPLDLKDIEIKVNYGDGSHRYLSLTSEMVESVTEESIILSYNGVTTAVNWQTEDRSEIRNSAEKQLSSLVESIKEGKEVSTEDFENFMEYRNEVNLSLEEIRLLDRAFYKAKDCYPVFYIEENQEDLSLSGLALAFDLDKKKASAQLYDDTYYVLSDSISSKNERILRQIGEAYGFKDAGSIHLSFRYNLNKVEPNSPIIVEVKLLDKEDDCIFSVYHIDEEGNVVKCYTTQSTSYIQFVMEESGDYIFLYKKSANTYRFADVKENISAFNNGVDSFGVMVEIMVAMIMLLYCFISYIIYLRLQNVNRKTWNMYYRLLKYMSH